MTDAELEGRPRALENSTAVERAETRLRWDQQEKTNSQALQKLRGIHCRIDELPAEKDMAMLVQRIENIEKTNKKVGDQQTEILRIVTEQKKEDEFRVRTVMWVKRLLWPVITFLVAWGWQKFL
jgi:hypothetical protein